MGRWEGIYIYQRVLLDCYGLWSWRLNAKLDVEDTNCGLPNLFGKLLVSEERVEILREYLEQADKPLILGSAIGLLWAAVPVPPIGGKELMVLGPIYTVDSTSQVAEQLLKPLHGLSFANKRGLLECLTHVPHISTVVFFQLVVMLHCYATGENVHPSDFVYRLPRSASPEELPWFDKGEGSQHASFRNEAALLDMVRTGNLEYQTALSVAIAASPGIRTRKSDPIQQAKYSVVAFITLCTRAAIEGGLSAEMAYTLSDTYTEEVDDCRTISQIAAVSHAMYEDFIRRVNRCRNAVGVSRAVQSCCDYIDTHPTEDLSAEALAARADYAVYYFSRLFKKQTGLTVKQYIGAARIRQARILLADTHMSVQEISDQLHFCSQSYFARQFQKAEGVSPVVYRARHQTG